MFAVPSRKLSKNEALGARGHLPIPEHFYSSSKGFAHCLPRQGHENKAQQCFGTSIALCMLLTASI